jgi:predicted DNA-binding protein (MmcQ/YjbR family)
LRETLAVIPEKQTNMDIETIEQICKALPNVKEEIKWKSDLVFMVAKKMFCVVDLESIPTSVAFKVPNENFDEISTTLNFKPAPYFAQHKWVTVININKISQTDLKQHIKTSYELVKSKLSKKALKELDDL